VSIGAEPMRIGAMPGRTALAEWARKLTAAEALGYSFFATGDVFAAMVVAARATRTALIGPTVTNPVTRDPLVMANEAAVVDEASNGRLVLWIGRGFSSVQTVAKRAATVSETGDYVNALHDLMRGRATTWQGQPIAPRPIDPVVHSPREVPLVLSAYGPRMMELAGQVADGVGIASAARPALMVDAITRVRTAAERAGRDPAGVQIWAMVRASVRDTREEALTDLKANLASGILHVPENDADMPDDVRRGVAQLRRQYAIGQHVTRGGHNERLLDEFGITEYAADRLAVFGTPEDCRRRLLELAEVGVQHLYFAAATADPDVMIRRMATEVVPELLAERNR
jgi:5,10-methylenetetrahydromethanopterin reductase